MIGSMNTMSKKYIRKVATLIKGMCVSDLHTLADILIDNENKYGNYNGQGLFQAMKNKHPELWERCKRDAKARMGGKHSARAMQLATQLYKKRGGGYR